MLFRTRAALWGGLCLVLLSACTGPSPVRAIFHSPDAEAVDDFRAQVQASAAVRTCQLHFLCERHLTVLDAPLVSRGTIAMAQPQSLRVSTQRPYLSEYLFHRDKLLARSEHDTQWRKLDLSARPGMVKVMQQLAGWTMGTTPLPIQEFQVTRSEAAVPPAPVDGASVENCDVFALQPLDGSMQYAVKRMLVAFDSHSHHVVYLQVTTPDEDQTAFWFYDAVINGPLSPETFAPAER